MRMIYLATALILLLAGASFAQMDTSQDMGTQGMDMSQVRATVQPGPVVRAGFPASADVFVGQRLVMRIPACAAGLSPMGRAQVIADRLNAAFDSGSSWTNTRVVEANGLWTVQIGDQLIATADPYSAQAFGISTGQLANRWANQTVLAMGGQPQQIFAQLQPVRQQVAGAQQQIGTAPTTGATGTRTVSLYNAGTGSGMGTATVSGPQSSLGTTGGVAVRQYTTEGATVYSFVPTTTGFACPQATRVTGIGVVTVPSSAFSTTGLRTGEQIEPMVSDAERWNTAINSQLTSANMAVGANTKVVPLYMDNTRIGAAQVTGTAQDLASTQAVMMSTEGDMYRFTASSSTTAMSPVSNVALSSVILFPESGAGM
ncbi:MAG: hypothetical protein ACYC2Y_08840 [Armatimonadota bacterium]